MLWRQLRQSLMKKYAQWHWTKQLSSFLSMICRRKMVSTKNALMKKFSLESSYKKKYTRTLDRTKKRYNCVYSSNLNLMDYIRCIVTYRQSMNVHLRIFTGSKAARKTLLRSLNWLRRRSSTCEHWKLRMSRRSITKRSESSHSTRRMSRKFGPIMWWKRNCWKLWRRLRRRTW